MFNKHDVIKLDLFFSKYPDNYWIYSW